MQSLDTLLPFIESGQRHIRRTADFRIDEYDSTGDANPVYDAARQQRVDAHRTRVQRDSLSGETLTIGKGRLCDGLCT